VKIVNKLLRLGFVKPVPLTFAMLAMMKIMEQKSYSDTNELLFLLPLSLLLLLPDLLRKQK